MIKKIPHPTPLSAPSS